MRPEERAIRRDAGRLLPAVIEVLASAGDPNAILSSVIDLILEATAADACFLHRWDPVERKLRLVAANDPYRHMVGKVELEVGEGVAGWVAHHRQPVVIPKDKWSDPRYKYIESLGGENYTSMVSVPLTSARSRLMGVLNIHTVEELHFGASELEFITATAKLVGTSLDNSELFQLLRQKESELEALVASSVNAQEAERRRVAREIHDGVTQILVALEYRLHAALAVSDERATPDLEKALELAGQALDESRRAIGGLRPPALEDLGLVPSLQQLAKQVTEGSGIEITIRAADDLDIGPEPSLLLYRIAQESLTNSAKHSKAASAVITIDSGPEVVSMVITDDGIGFDVPAALEIKEGASYGLIGMRERVELAGGRFRITSERQKGTRIDVRIPE